MLRLFPALFTNPIAQAEPDPEGLDFSAFSSMPSSDQAALESAGVTQEQLDATAAGQLWWFGTQNLYSDTAATTLIAGVAGNQIAAWKSWDGNVLSQATAGNRPLYQTNGVSFTASSSHWLNGTVTPMVGAQNDRVAIALIEFTNATTLFQDFLSNGGGSTAANRWSLRYNPLSGDPQTIEARLDARNSTKAADNAFPANQLLMLRYSATSNTANVDLWKNGVLNHSATGLGAADANPNPNTLTVGRYSTYGSIALRALFVGNISTAQAALVEQLIEAIAGTALLP